MKKRLPLLLTALCFLLCAAPLAGCTPAEEDVYGPTEKPGYPCENDEYTYLIHPESGEVTITSYLGTAEEVVVPAELDGYPVTAIQYFTIRPAAKALVKSVVLPDGLTEIGRIAFCGSALEEIEIPDSVQRIGPDAFYSTPWLDAQTDEFVIVGDGVLIDWHPSDALPYTPYDELIIPDNVKFIAFSYMREAPKAIRTLTIPGTVRAIGEKAFKNMYIEKLTIGDGVKKIGAGAFCSSLTGDHVTLPNSVTHIGDEAFAYNQELRAVFLGNRIL